MVAFSPTPAQAAAIAAPLEPLLLVAGAGSGKTTVMAQRILHLVGSGQVRADQVLGLTFTNKAAANLEERVRAALGPDNGVVVSTYHGFGASLVADHGLELGLDPGTRLLNRAQAWQLLYGVFDEFRFQHRLTLAPELILDDALALASRCADFLVPVEAVADDAVNNPFARRWKNVAEAAAKRGELCQVVAAYGRRKRERNMLDYGDQLALAVRLLHDHPEVADAVRELHPVVLLDEYQDTNFAQRRLLQRIYPPGWPVCAVGDDMQSIYAFRGAHRWNILRFHDHFGRAGGPTGGAADPAAAPRLESTFRFGPRLVTLANRIQAQVPDALPKALDAAPGAPDTRIEYFLAADDAEEAATIAADIAARGAPWSANAVLCRKRRLVPGVVDALRSRGVPVEAVGTSGLLDRPEVVDLMAWLEQITDPGAVTPLLRLLMGPRYAIGRRDLGALARHSRVLDSEAPETAPHSVADALADLPRVGGLSPAARTRLEDFRREGRELAAEAAGTPVVDLAETVALRTGLWRAGGHPERENLLRLLDLAQQFTPVEGEPDLAAFVEYVQLLDRSEEDLAEAHPSDTDAVRVMTVHQAKGLEFEVVYVPGLAGSGSSRIFPDDRAADNALTNSSALPTWLREDDEGLPDPGSSGLNAVTTALRQRRLEEEWRLFYVACTRARQLLVCSAAHWYAGASAPQGPSAFYDFVASQADLATERFRKPAAGTDPEVVAKERRRAAAAALQGAAVTADPAQLSLDHMPPARRPGLAPAVPTTLSVTSLVMHARCPASFYWTVVRPLPRRSSAAARLGTEVHRRIELRAGRQLGLLPDSDFDAPKTLGWGGHAEPLTASLEACFVASPWGALDPLKVEAPFVLAVGRHLVRGRIDAVYERDGRIEIVDLKTGRRPPQAGPERLQLDLYALAATEAWGVDPLRLRTTFCWLRADGPAEVDSTDWDRDLITAVRDRLAAVLDSLAGSAFDPTPGRWCGPCDFLPACSAGQAAVGDRLGSGA